MQRWLWPQLKPLALLSLSAATLRCLHSESSRPNQDFWPVCMRHHKTRVDKSPMKYRSASIHHKKTTGNKNSRIPGIMWPLPVCVTWKWNPHSLSPHILSPVTVQLNGTQATCFQEARLALVCLSLQCNILEQRSREARFQLLYLLSGLRAKGRSLY